MNAQVPITTASVTLDARELSKALAFVQQVVHRRNTIPVIGMVRMTTETGRVTITGTDLDSWLTATLAPEAQGPHLDVMIAPRFLSGLIYFHDGPVTIEQANGAKGIPVLTITAGDVVARLNVVCPVSDFPLPPDGFAGAETFGAAELAKALKPMMPCISTEETRYYLNGIYLHPVNGHLRMVATDGHKLAMYDCEARWPFLSAIFPRRAAAIVLAKLGPGANGSVTIQPRVIHEPVPAHPSLPKVPRLHSLLLKGDGWRMITKNIDGTFPDYTRVIPKPNGSISCSISHSAIRRFPRDGFDRSRAVRIAPDEGKMTVTSPEGIEVSMPVQGTGEAFGLNLRYVLELAAPAGVIRLEGSRAGDPFLVHSDDPALTQVVMPMRV